MPTSKTPFPTPPPRALIRSSLVIYSVMFLVGFEICWWYHQNVAQVLGVRNANWLQFIKIVVVSVLFLTLGQHCLEAFFPSYRRLKLTFAQLFCGLSFPQILLLALLSSVGEEMLFRGAIQPFLGVWFTSVLFAMLHVDPEGRFSVWTIWSLVGGLVMGYAVLATGSLWPAILIHFFVNVISIHRVVRLTQNEIDRDTQNDRIVSEHES